MTCLPTYGISVRAGLVILHGGRILVEAYWDVPREDGSGYANMADAPMPDGSVVEDVASVQKSVVSFLVGVARGQGLLNLEDSVSTHLGAGWSNTSLQHETAIQLRHLLSMTSGLATDLSYQQAPGEKWMYNTNAYSQLVPVLEAATGLSVDASISQWLTAPTGMTRSSWEPRRWVRPGADANRSVSGRPHVTSPDSAFSYSQVAGGMGKISLGTPRF